MKKINDYKSLNDEQSQNYYADHTPKGKLLANRFDLDSPMYKLILCLATFIKIVTSQIEVLIKNWNINKTEELLSEWEADAKIPERFPRRETLADRREAVKRLISRVPVYNIRDSEQTVNDYTTFERYIEIMTGITVEITNGDTVGASFPLQFPVVFGAEFYGSLSHFTIKVPGEGQPPNNFFPLPFPVIFFNPGLAQAQIDLLTRVVEEIIPAYCSYEFELLPT